MTEQMLELNLMMMREEWYKEQHLNEANLELMMALLRTEE